MVKKHKKSKKKVICIPKITNTFDLSSQKSKKKTVVFFSDFSNGITQVSKSYDIQNMNQIYTQRKMDKHHLKY